MNEKAQSTGLKDNQATSLNNVSFDTYGAATKRNGFETVIDNVKTDIDYADRAFSVTNNYTFGSSYTYGTTTTSVLNLGINTNSYLPNPWVSTQNLVQLSWNTISDSGNSISGKFHIAFTAAASRGSGLPSTLNPIIQSWIVASANNYLWPSPPYISTLGQENVLYPSTNYIEIIVTSVLVDRILASSATTNIGVLINPLQGNYTSQNVLEYRNNATWNIVVDLASSYFELDYNSLANVISTYASPNVVNRTARTSSSSWDNQATNLYVGDIGSSFYHDGYIKFPTISTINGDILSVKFRYYVNELSPTTFPDNILGIYSISNTWNINTTSPNTILADFIGYKASAIGWNDTSIPIDTFKSWYNNNYGLKLIKIGSGYIDMSSSFGLNSPEISVVYISTQNNSVSKIYSYTNNSGTEYLYGTNSTNILIANTSSNFTSTYASITNYNLSSAQYNGLIYFTSTTNGLIVSNGTNTRLVDYTAPFTMTVATYNAGSALGIGTGTYYYKYSLVDDLGESYTSSYVPITINLTTTAVSIGIATDSTASFNSFKIYRTLAGPSTISVNYYFVISSVATNSIKDTYTDTTLQASSHFSPINKPPKAKYVYALKNRLWLANTVTNNNMVFCSAPLDPSSVYDSVLYWELDYPYSSEGQSNLFPIIGGAVTGLSDLFDSLLVFTPRSIFAGIGDDPSGATGFYMKKTSSLSGTRAPQSIAKSESTVYFLSEDNRVASFSSNGNRGLDAYTFDYLYADFIGDIIPDVVDSIDYTYAPIASGIFFDNKYYCSVPGIGSTVNTFTVVYENKLPAFSRYNIGASSFAIKDNELYFCSSSDGFSYKFNSAWDDASNTIPFLYQTKWLVLQDPYQDKKLRELWIKSKATSVGTLHYDIYTDFSETAKVSGNITTTGTGEIVTKVNGNDILKVNSFKRIKFGISSNDTSEAQLQSIRGSYDYLKTN